MPSRVEMCSVFEFGISEVRTTDRRILVLVLLYRTHEENKNLTVKPFTAVIDRLNCLFDATQSLTVETSPDTLIDSLKDRIRL